MSTPDRGGTERAVGEPSLSLSRADLAMLLIAERRLAFSLARPAEVLRFFLSAVEETAALLRVDRAVLCLIDGEDQRLLRVMAGTGVMADEEGEVLPVEGSFEGRVFLGVEPIRSRDLSSEPDLYRPRQNERRAGPAIGVPLRSRNRSIGVLLVGREPDGVPFLERDAEMLREFAVPITAAIEAMRQFDSARRSRAAVDAWNREQALRQWVARYDAIAAARAEIVFRLLPSGSMEWGASTDQLFGIAPADFAPHFDDLLRRILPADVEMVRAAMRTLAPGGPPTVAVSCGLVLPNGSVQPRRLIAWRTEGEGDIVGVLTTATGAVNTERVDDDPEGVGESIVRALRHQINNPLAALIGRAQLLIRDEKVQEDAGLRQGVETILFEGERIARFVQQLQSVDGMRRLRDPLPGEQG